VVPLLECVVNVSEGRRTDVIDALAASADGALLDVHTDPDHHRSVFTLAGPSVEEAARALTAAAVAALDLRDHAGAHPRIGVVDVVPFVPLGTNDLSAALVARDRFAAWAGASLALPCFLYGPQRSLPEVRREAFGTLRPDTGPFAPHPTAGGCAVGARPLLVAYNVWLAEPDLARARAVATELRSPAIRALGLQVGSAVQVSMNLVAPDEVGPVAAYDAVAARVPVARAELVGLLPASVLAGVPHDRWSELDVSAERTLEARLDRKGLRP
jgi:glutamate formiminotransferase